MSLSEEDCTKVCGPAEWLGTATRGGSFLVETF